MEISSTLILTGLVLALILYVSWKRDKKYIALPPGPRPLPLLGNLLQIDKRAPFTTLLELSRVYGPVLTVYFGPQRVVVLVGYKTVKEALCDQADDFADRGPIPLMRKITEGYGLDNNGRSWEQLRRFTLGTLRNFGMGRKNMEEWILAESKYLIDRLAKTNSVPCDPTHFLSQTVSNVICALVFGQRFEYHDNDFLQLLEFISQAVLFMSTPLGQLYNIFPWLMDRLPGYQHKVLVDADKLKTFIMEKINQHDETLSPGSPRDFIDCFLIRLKQEKDNPTSEFHYKSMVAIVLALFIAGTETTSTTLRYALKMLVKHPNIQEKIQLEIDTVIGRDRCPLMEDRKSLPFTNAVIHEIQRYLDMAPMNVPHFATSDIVFKGYIIPKGTYIFPLLHSVLRDETQWESPWTFNPGHFLDHNGNFKNNPAHIPFSAGKRACLGESLAKMELFLFLVSLLQHFTFSCPGGPQNIETTPECGTFSKTVGKYELIATPR